MPSGIFTLKQQTIAVQEAAWPGTKTPAVDYLVVAGGGGGGGSNIAGGGGAGGLLIGNTKVVAGSAITVTVGAGGTGGPAASVNNGGGTNGSNSVFGQISCLGGGYGGGYNAAGNGGAGGSGGGGGQGLIGSRGTAYQGNQGGTGSFSNTNGGGGGGGAGARGVDAGSGSSQTLGGYGGDGFVSDISGVRTAYAGGGGGGQRNQTVANGGIGGGGGSSNNPGTAAATANTGGGGGGASGDGSGTAGGNGGSGIVIISYPDTYAAATSTTGSPTVSTSGSGSFSFNGSNQTISTASSSLLALGTGDFTIEFWVKINGSGSFSRSFLITGSASVSLESNTYTSAVTPYYLNYGGTQTAVTTGSSFDVTQWHHVAIVRSGVSIRVYLNGVQAMSATDATAYTSNGTLYLGSNNSANWLNGNVTNFRLVKGTAIYTSAFTPPSAPLTVVSGTSILTSVVSGAYLADSSGNGFTFTNTGSTAWNSASPFATGLGYKNRVYTWTSSGSITF